MTARPLCLTVVLTITLAIPGHAAAATHPDEEDMIVGSAHVGSAKRAFLKCGSVRPACNRIASVAIYKAMLQMHNGLLAYEKALDCGGNTRAEARAYAAAMRLTAIWKRDPRYERARAAINQGLVWAQLLSTKPKGSLWVCQAVA